MNERTTVDQLYNAGLAMNLAAGTEEHDARSAQFMDLFEQASVWTRLVAMVRVVAWRWRRR